jgi:beta-phosphoglucomutase
MEKYKTAINYSFYTDYCAGALSLHIARQLKICHSTVSISAHDLALKKDMYFDEWIKTNPAPLMPYVKETATYLYSKNIKLGIVTGAPVSAIQKTLEENNLSDFIHVKITRESAGNGKPAPDGYVMALNKLEVMSNEAIAVEDTTSGILAAKAAGLRSFAVPHFYTAKHDFAAADVVCRDMLEVLEILRREV